jgi:chemotaxis protein CheC
LAALRSAFHQGSADASLTLAKWIGRPSLVEIDSLDQLPLEEATGTLGVGDEPIGFCLAEMQGLLTGELILAFDDASGLALSDMLLEQPVGRTRDWTELAMSAVMETTNILACAYLNSLLSCFRDSGGLHELLPSPPVFRRDFAECLLEFALMGQAVAGDWVVLAQTRFEIDREPVNWRLLFVPDAPSMSRLVELLPGTATPQ